MTFEKWSERVTHLKARPSNEELLQLYALYKQGTQGDVSGARPGMLQLKERAKYDAWAKHKNKDKMAAQKEYMLLAENLVQKYGEGK